MVSDFLAKGKVQTFFMWGCDGITQQATAQLHNMDISAAAAPVEVALATCVEDVPLSSHSASKESLLSVGKHHYSTQADVHAGIFFPRPPDTHRKKKAWIFLRYARLSCRRNCPASPPFARLEIPPLRLVSATRRGRDFSFEARCRQSEGNAVFLALYYYACILQPSMALLSAVTRSIRTA